ncbi:MAG: amidohydrolase [bacterium]|nr:amidohydrolase [bacterium]
MHEFASLRWLLAGSLWPTFLGLWTCAQVVRAQPAELIIKNAVVLQCNPSMGESDAVAVRDGRVVAVGSQDILDSLISDQTQIIDAQGQTLTPGFCDSHLHFVGLGQSLQMLDLSQAESWADIVAQVEQAAKLLPKGAWIEGRGWHQSKWKRQPVGAVDGYPSHGDMSLAVPDHPVLLTHASGHACFANELAMRMAGVGPDTSDPAGGEILKDENGQPIGVFRENAQSLIRRVQARSNSRMSVAERSQLLSEQVRLAGEECLRHGITSVHDAGSSFQLAENLAEMAKSNELPVRVYMMIRTGSDELQAKMPASRFEAVGGHFFTVRSVKVSIDGALGPHGAWLLQPYEDLPESAGLNTVALDEMERIAELCQEHGWQLCVHAIGDRANREVLDVYEKVLGTNVHSDHRWRIEHAQHLSVSDIPRFAALGVIPVMQANHCTSDAIFVPTRLGERRSRQGAYVWRSLIDCGSIIPNGTDAPVERIDPRVSLYAAVTRRLSNGDLFYPEQCMTREEALLSYTLWPAIAAFQENDLGSIEVGKQADLVLWDRDLLRCQPEEILGANVQKTILQGRIVFDASLNSALP